MTTITLTLPDDLAATLSALPEGERNNYAIALMRQGLAAEQEYEESEEEKAEILAALMESKAQDEAGLSLTLEEMDAAFAERQAQVQAKLAARNSVSAAGY